MSHYVVLVLGENVEEQLRPYYENTEDPALTVFEEDETEHRQKFESEMEVLRAPDGKCYYSGEKHPPAGSVLVKAKGPELFGSFERYMAEWCGYKAPDPRTGKYGCWVNPNAKWDWYCEGGRWPDYLPLRKGSYATQALKQDIDFERARTENEREALGKWDQVHAIVAGREWPPLWEELRDKYPDNLDTARGIYNNHPVICDLSNAGLLPFEVEDSPLLRGPREAFGAWARKRTLVPYAIVKEGRWFARGKMGWFAVTHDAKDYEDWITEANGLLDNTSGDTLITVIDCHI